MTIPYEIGAVLGSLSATPAPAPPRPTEVIPGIPAAGRTGADGANADRAAHKPSRAAADRGAPTDDDEARDVATEDPPADAAPAASPIADRYTYNVRFTLGLSRPLMEIVDTATQETVASYPPKQRARMLALADALGRPAPDAEPTQKLDASA